MQTGHGVYCIAQGRHHQTVEALRIINLGGYYEKAKNFIFTAEWYDFAAIYNIASWINEYLDS